MLVLEKVIKQISVETLSVVICLHFFGGYSNLGVNIKFICILLLKITLMQKMHDDNKRYTHLKAL